MDAHDRLQPEEEADPVLGNLQLGRPCEDNLVRLPGGGSGVEDLQHPNYLVVRPHGVENNGDLDRVLD